MPRNLSTKIISKQNILLIGLVTCVLAILRHIYVSGTSGISTRSNDNQEFVVKSNDNQEFVVRSNDNQEFAVKPFFQLPKDNVELVKMTSIGNKALSGIQIALHPKGEFISDQIRAHGSWESFVAEKIIQTLRTFPQASFIDIGANIGAHSLQVASSGRKVVAVEPNPRNCELISKSLEANGWKDRITIVNHAVDNKRSKAFLLKIVENVGGSFLAEKSETLGPGRELMNITTIVFDDLLTIVDFKTAIMKIDIEGAEHRALQKANKFFQTVNVPVVFMEWTRGSGKRPADTNEQIIQFFTSRNYSAFDLSEPKNSLSKTNQVHWPGDIVWMKKTS